MSNGNSSGVLSPPVQTPPQVLNKQISQTYSRTGPGINTGSSDNVMSPLPPARRALNAQTAQINNLDFTFTLLFKEAKSEVVKLLRDDKFPRWKQTAEFAHFISSIKPYEQEVTSGGGTRRSVMYNNSLGLMENSQGE